MYLAWLKILICHYYLILVFISKIHIIHLGRPLRLYKADGRTVDCGVKTVAVHQYS